MYARKLVFAQVMEFAPWRTFRRLPTKYRGDQLAMAILRQLLQAISRTHDERDDEEGSENPASDIHKNLRCQLAGDIEACARQSVWTPPHISLEARRLGQPFAFKLRRCSAMKELGRDALDSFPQRSFIHVFHFRPWKKGVRHIGRSSVGRRNKER
jgi:hypothetical protein